MDSDELRAFVGVPTREASQRPLFRLGVAKSIISHRLFKREAELGVQLLIRTTRGANTEPPPTRRLVPVRKLAGSDVRNTTAAATPHTSD